jgi:hypothetical protein
MKFWPAALILVTLLLGGWGATHPFLDAAPDCLGHFVGSSPLGEIELSLHASPDTPGGVEGSLLLDGEKWQSVRGTVHWSKLTLPAFTGRFREDDAGNRVLDVGKLRLVRVATDSQIRLEQPGLRVDCAHPLVTFGPPTLRKAVEQAQADAFESMKELFRALAQDLEDAGRTTVDWYWTDTWDIAVRTERLVSLFGTSDYYTGGAHPNIHYKTRTFWVDGGVTQEIHLADLFNPCTPEWGEELSARVFRQLREAGASNAASETYAGFEVSHLDRWILTRRGIEAHFAPYVMGSYAEGSFSALVRYEDIRHLLNPVGPAAEFLR